MIRLISQGRGGLGLDWDDEGGESAILRSLSAVMNAYA